MDALKIFDRLMLDKVDQSWVQSVWDNEFIVFDKIDDEYSLFLESNDMDMLLRDISEIIKHWINVNNNSETENNNVSWQTLRGLNVDPRYLLALLGYLIKIGHDQGINEQHRQICLRSTSLYLTLLTVPGSSVYQIFHENLYQKVLDTLGFIIHLWPSDKKSNRNLDLEYLYSNNEETNKLSQREKTTLTKGLNAVVYDLILLLKSSSWSFRGHERSLEATVNALVQITKFGNDSNSTVTAPSSGSLSTLSQNSYAALQLLCQNRQGSTEITIKLIATSMIQNFIYNYGNLSVKMSGVVKDTSVQFMQTLLEDYGEKAEIGISILIQRLMINCPERLEVRQKMAIIIFKLINIAKIRTNFMKKIIDDLILFSHQNKVSHRVFAQEIIRRYLLDATTALDESIEEGNEGLKIKKILLATVLSRCMDVSCIVRSRALATLKEYTDQPLNHFLTILFTSKDDDEQHHHQTTATLEDLRNSIHSNISILPEKDFILSMLEIRAEDERALIRRSTILIFENAVTINSDILVTTIEIVSKHCRDPAMTVRRSSIQVLTSLLEKYPDHPNFYKLWIKSVIPQIFDIEISVQEKVLEVFECLIIQRILSSSETNKNDNLSWKIVNTLSFMKMRKHLTKICDAWARNSIITNDFITKVQSKIGSEHNQAVWILLSSISEVTKLSKMEEYFLNSHEFLQGKEFIDYLSLEVLRSSLLNLKKHSIQKIQIEFYKRLSAFQVHPRIISLALDIFYSTHPKNNEDQEDDFQSMIKNLITKSETVIKKIIENDEYSKTDDVDLYLKAVSTLGHVSFLCKTKIELSVIRVLQGILIDNETIPAVIKNRIDIQAAIVVILGQQAMRDQSIAHEMMPIFRQLLCNTPENINTKLVAAVRVNAAKALVDVCTRFTSLVEPFLPDICITMKDSERTVREAIVVLFIELLVEDFIKIKGSFFFHILTMLTDEDETIRDMTIFLVKERLLMKNKSLISTQFFEAIFHYNGVKFKNKFHQSKKMGKEKAILILPGNENEEKRKIIYRFLLDNLEPIGWIKLLEKISGTLEGIGQAGTFNVKKNYEKCLLKDILWIVSRDFNQISGLGARTESVGEEDETPVGNTGLIGEKIEKYKVTVLLPTLAKLRRKLNRFEELDAEIVEAFIRTSDSLNKDQLATIYGEFPEIEEKVERNLRYMDLCHKIIKLNLSRSLLKYKYCY